MKRFLLVLTILLTINVGATSHITGFGPFQIGKLTIAQLEGLERMQHKIKNQDFRIEEINYDSVELGYHDFIYHIRASGNKMFKLTNVKLNEIDINTIYLEFYKDTLYEVVAQNMPVSVYNLFLKQFGNNVQYSQKLKSPNSKHPQVVLKKYTYTDNGIISECVGTSDDLRITIKDKDVDSFLYSFQKRSKIRKAEKQVDNENALIQGKGSYIDTTFETTSKYGGKMKKSQTIIVRKDTVINN